MVLVLREVLIHWISYVRRPVQTGIRRLFCYVNRKHMKGVFLSTVFRSQQNGQTPNTEGLQEYV
jgi:hypothetical protein